jgi:transposase
MIEALIAGERDRVLATWPASGCGRDPRAAAGALAGRFGEHHAAMLRLHLTHIDQLDALIGELDRAIEAKLSPSR